MDIESDITLKIFSGAIPVIITLAESDNTPQNVVNAPRDPLHMLLLRCAYLPLYSPIIKSHFFLKSPGNSSSGFTVDDSTELWFSDRGVPLKWHYSIGLLHDIVSHTTLPITNPSSAATPSPTINHFSTTTPWRLTLHVSSFPADKIFKSIANASLQNDPPRDFYMNALKESEFIRHISIKKVMSLPKPDQMLLWNSLSDSVSLIGGGSISTVVADWSDLEIQTQLAQVHDAFWGVNQRLMGNVGGGGEPHQQDASLSPTVSGVGRSVAVRLYLGYDKPVVQDLVSPDGTLLHALHILVPNLVPTSMLPPTKSEQQPPRNSETGEGAEQGDPLTSHMKDMELKEKASRTESSSSLNTPNAKEFKIITHGIQVPLDTPLIWLSRHLSYPDNFLHLVLAVV
ncbi:UNVERIFIED_CONTAM: autophagy protein 5 [Siphonaria sp. JEL0065]|nr:autophagy protein 5 [Siphonaria sp. JEL0065]